MEKFIVDVPTEFTQYDLDCIWSSALSGISYWAVLEKIDRSNLLVEENYNGYIDGKMPLDDMLTRGVVFKLRDIDDDDNKPKIFILNLEKLKLGVQRYYAYGNGKKKVLISKHVTLIIWMQVMQIS